MASLDASSFHQHPNHFHHLLQQQLHFQQQFQQQHQQQQNQPQNHFQQKTQQQQNHQLSLSQNLPNTQLQYQQNVQQHHNLGSYAGGGGGGVASHESQLSSEDDETNSRSSAGPHKKPRPSPSAAETDPGETALVPMTKKPRGRPPGSKNKPKPPVIISHDSDNAMRPHILEVAGGYDIHDSLATYSRRRGRGICLLSGSGTVSNVTLRQPLAPPGATVRTFPGRFEILSLSGSFLGNASGSAGGGTGQLTISLAGAQGQVIGGSVVGALMAAGPVVIIAASFLSATCERVPATSECPANDESPDNHPHSHQQHLQQFTDGSSDHNHNYNQAQNQNPNPNPLPNLNLNHNHNSHHMAMAPYNTSSSASEPASTSAAQTTIFSPAPLNCQLPQGLGFY